VRFLPALTRAAALGAAAVLAATGLTACGDDAATGKAANPYGLLQPGVLRAGTLTDAPPNVYLKDGKFTGFDNDLMTAVAAKLGLKVEFVGTDFSALLSQVNNHKFDAGSSSVTITEARKKTVDYATKEGLDPVRVPDYNGAINQLKAKTADAWISPAEIGEKSAQDSGGKIVLVEKQLSSAPTAFVVAKGNDPLREALNKGLDQAIEDGTWTRLQDQYYPGRPIPETFKPGSGTVTYPPVKAGSAGSADTPASPTGTPAG
jgi:ABC-type amino acid transport substrate-binding protein